MDAENSWIKEAINQVMADCDLQKENGTYEMVSLRGVLTKLGYTQDQTVDVIFYVAEKGFDYCLDNIVSHKDIDSGEVSFPGQQHCYWGPDQLKSRLRSVV